MPSTDNAFNPLIHGTNSTILAMLPHTQMRITSTIKMLNEYRMAPLCGEVGDSLWGGGLGLHADKYISFGRMNASYDKYGLERVTSSYATVALNSGEGALAKFIDRDEFTRTHGYEDINIMLVYLSRAKLLGTSLTAEKHAEITKTITGVIQYHYFMLLLVKHVRVDQELLREHVRHDRELLSKNEKLRKIIEDPEHARLRYEEYKKSIPEELKQFLSDGYVLPDISYEKYIEQAYDYLISEKFRALFKHGECLERIIEKNIDLKDIYENHTPENLQKISPLLGVTSPEIQFFILGDTTNNFANSSPRFKQRDIHTFYIEPGKEAHSNFIDNITHGEHMVDVSDFESITLSRIKSLEAKLVLMNEIVNGDTITFSKNQQRFIDEPFPIILISEAEEKVRFVNQEYRTHEDLTLGKDITMIATDTPEHQKAIMDFLAENHIDNVQAVLFEQLKQSQVDGKRPVPNLQRAEALFTPAPLPELIDLRMAFSS